MNLEFTAAAMEDYQYWKSNQPSKAAKIKAILKNILDTPSPESVSKLKDLGTHTPRPRDALE